MNKVIHAYIGSFDELGRLTLVPAPDGTATSDIDEPGVSVLFGHMLTEAQKDTLKSLGQAFCGQVGGILDHSGNERHMWPPSPQS